MLNSLIKNLSKPLPGREVQYQMAPSDREDRFKKTADKKTIESAVMILLFEEKGELYTAFIQRPQYNGPHGGQISFPGGKYEQEEDNNLQAIWVVKVDSCGCTGVNIEKIQLTDTDVLVYPNPASTYVQVESKKLKIESIEIYDIFGKVLKQLTITRSNNLTIEIEDLPKGIYLLRIKTNNSVLIKKFVRN